ncbi:hypothetical protein Tco_0033460 [Tanacetum coccineum]
MSTMAENIIAVGVDNRSPMLEKSQYNSRQSRMKLYIRGKKHGKDLLDSFLNGLFKYGTIEVPNTSTTPETTRPRTYEDLTDKEKILKPRRYGTELSYSSKVHNCHCKNASLSCTMSLINLHRRKGKSIHSYYLRFAQLINDMNTIGMAMQKLQVNTKFVNNLQPEWSKLVTDVKLARDMHESSFDQLYAYIRQHEDHTNEVRMMREGFPNPLALVANSYITPPY